MGIWQSVPPENMQTDAVRCGATIYGSCGSLGRSCMHEVGQISTFGLELLGLWVVVNS